MALAVWEGVNASMDAQVARLTGRRSWPARPGCAPCCRSCARVLLVALVAVFGLTALSEIGVNIAPLLAGAGILGVAIGFGSQKLVQDFITGIFLLLENAMQVGDWVTVAGLSGTVENLSIRTMRLRAGDGSVHIIPFSSVSTVTNVNRGIGNAAVSVHVADRGGQRPGQRSAVGHRARACAARTAFAEMMRSDFQLWGVDKVDAGVRHHRGPDRVHRCRPLGGAARVQPSHDDALQGAGPAHRDAGADGLQPHRQRGAGPPPLAAIDAAPANQLQHSPPPAALGNTA